MAGTILCVTCSVLGRATRALVFSRSRRPGPSFRREARSSGLGRLVCVFPVPRAFRVPNTIYFIQRSTRTVSGPFSSRWRLRPDTQFVVGMAIGYIVLTTVYYSNTFNGRDIKWMSTNLFGLDGQAYNQSAVLTPDNKLDPSKLAGVGLPRYTATYVVSQVRLPLKKCWRPWFMSSLSSFVTISRSELLLCTFSFGTGRISRKVRSLRSSMVRP